MQRSSAVDGSVMETSRFNKGKHYTHHLLVKFCRNTDNCKLSVVKKKEKILCSFNLTF